MNSGDSISFACADEMRYRPRVGEAGEKSPLRSQRG